MVEYKLTIFRQGHNYTVYYDNNQEGRDRTVRDAKVKGFELVFDGHIEGGEQSFAMLQYLKEANKTGRFDREELTDLIGGVKI